MKDIHDHIADIYSDTAQSSKESMWNNIEYQKPINNRVWWKLLVALLSLILALLSGYTHTVFQNNDRLKSKLETIGRKAHFYKQQSTQLGAKSIMTVHDTIYLKDTVYTSQLIATKSIAEPKIIHDTIIQPIIKRVFVRDTIYIDVEPMANSEIPNKVEENVPPEKPSAEEYPEEITLILGK